MLVLWIAWLIFVSCPHLCIQMLPLYCQAVHRCLLINNLHDFHVNCKIHGYFKINFFSDALVRVLSILYSILGLFLICLNFITLHLSVLSSIFHVSLHLNNISLPFWNSVQDPTFWVGLTIFTLPGNTYVWVSVSFYKISEITFRYC